MNGRRKKGKKEERKREGRKEGKGKEGRKEGTHTLPKPNLIAYFSLDMRYPFPDIAQAIPLKGNLSPPKSTFVNITYPSVIL